MKKLTLLLIAACMLLASCASTDKTEYSSIGKEGEITLTIPSACTITSIDGQPVKLKRKCKLEPGYHTFVIAYSKTTSNSTSVTKATATVTEDFYFETGHSYSMKEFINHQRLYLPVRDAAWEKFTDSKYFISKIPEPELKGTIKYLNSVPVNQKYEIVGLFEFTLTGGMLSTGTMSADMSLNYLQSFVENSDKEVDALLDPCSIGLVGVYGYKANAIGIKFLNDDDVAAEPKESEEEVEVIE
jgi:hypothetical protein